MAVTFEQLFASMTQQESGGNYGALGVWLSMPYGRDRAYGRYQVMGNNIPSWSRKYLGRTLTPQQYLNDKAAQDKIARGRFKELYDQYGARGAAAAWYSGNPALHNSTAPVSSGPTIKQYVDEVIARAGGLPSSGGSTTSSSGSGYTGGTVPKLSFEELAEQYGYTAAMLKANPELKKLFDQMVSGEWTKDKFQAKLRETKWWKTLSSDERQFMTLKYTDPATAKQKQDQALIKITQIAKQLGLTGKYGTADFLKSYAYNLVAKGWDEGRVRYELARFLNPNMKTHTGEAGAAWDEIDAYAYGMGVKLSEGWIRTRAVNIVRGLGTVQDVKNEVANMAKAQFPQWSKQIDGGQTVADIAMPYMQSMSEILELNPGSINLFDPTIKNTLSWMNPQSGKKEAKPMWQFENELRGDVRWKKTKNAQDSLMQVAHQVLSDFGVKY